MKVRYTKWPTLTDPEIYNWHPELQVCLRVQNGTRGRVIRALVDSGAIDCIFPESLGRLIGLDVPSGKPTTYFGVADQMVTGFLHTIQLQVTGLDRWIDLEAGFVMADIRPLLGQRGFFEAYQVVFERWRYQFELNSREQAIMRGRRGR